MRFLCVSRIFFIRFWIYLILIAAARKTNQTISRLFHLEAYIQFSSIRVFLRTQCIASLSVGIFLLDARKQAMNQSNKQMRNFLITEFPIDKNTT